MTPETALNKSIEKIADGTAFYHSTRDALVMKASAKIAGLIGSDINETVFVTAAAYVHDSLDLCFDAIGKGNDLSPTVRGEILKHPAFLAGISDTLLGNLDKTFVVHKALRKREHEERNGIERANTMPRNIDVAPIMEKTVWTGDEDVGVIKRDYPARKGGRK